MAGRAVTNDLEATYAAPSAPLAVTFAQWLRRRFCSHECRVDDIRRLSRNMVEAPCVKCGAPLRAAFGLALPCKLIFK